MTTERTGSRIQTTETTLEIVAALHELDGARVEEVADHLDIASSTVHRHLATLADHGYVIKEGDIYHIGSRFLTMGGYAQTRKRAYNLARKTVEKVSNQTEERAQFLIEEHGERVYLETRTGKHAVETDAYLGKRGPLHCSAAGKAILAALPESRTREIIDQRGLEEVTENTITDRDELFEELDAIRERGVAFNREESTMGLNAVGTSVVTASGEVLGALSVSGPAHRLKGDRLTQDLPDTLLGFANELELKIKYP